MDIADTVARTVINITNPASWATQKLISRGALYCEPDINSLMKSNAMLVTTLENMKKNSFNIKKYEDIEKAYNIVVKNKQLKSVDQVVNAAKDAVRMLRPCAC